MYLDNVNDAQTLVAHLQLALIVAARAELIAKVLRSGHKRELVRTRRREITLIEKDRLVDCEV